MGSQTVAVLMGVALVLVAARFVAAVVVGARPGSRLGVRTAATLAGAPAWVAGHRAARLLLLLGAGLGILDAFAVVLAAANMGPLATAGMGVVLLGLLGLLWLTARSVANKVAKATTTHN